MALAIVLETKPMLSLTSKVLDDDSYNKAIQDTLNILHSRYLKQDIKRNTPEAKIILELARIVAELRKKH